MTSIQNIFMSIVLLFLLTSVSESREFKVRIDNSFSIDEQAEIWTGLRKWSKVGANIEFKRVNSEQGPELIIERVPFPPRAGAWATWQFGTIRLWSGTPYQWIRATIAHEFGHHLMLPHSPNPSDIMYPHPNYSHGNISTLEARHAIRLYGER